MILQSVAQQTFRDAETRGVTGKALMWEIDQADIMLDLDTFLKEDSRLRQRFGVSPHSAEARFGMSAPSWDAVDVPVNENQTLRFRGIIDRVDTDPSGKVVLVIDYKTGGSGSYDGLKKDPIDGGKRLQLPIYALAALNALGPEADVRAAYWFVTSQGRFTLIPPEPVSFKEIQERFQEAVSAIVSGIAQGLFPAHPGKEDRGGFENCHYCEFNTLCHTRRDVIWQRKKRDPRLAAYLKLAGED